MMKNKFLDRSKKLNLKKCKGKCLESWHELNNDYTYSQGSQQFGKIFKKSENQPPVANAGSDIKAAPGSTITISGEKSGDPNGDILQFEWSLPPSLMAKDNYTYDNTDTVNPHKGISED